MGIFSLAILAVVGMVMVMFGLFQVSGAGLTTGARLAAWGGALCVAALTTGLRVLQKQIDVLKAEQGKSGREAGDAE